MSGVAGLSGEAARLRTPHRKCLVLLPVEASRPEVRLRAKNLFDFVLQPAVEAAGYSVVREPQTALFGDVSVSSIRLLCESALVMADLTGADPQVMYKLGVRHALGKPTIHITSERQTAPFDVNTDQLIRIGEVSTVSAPDAKGMVLQAIRALEDDPDGNETPVSTALKLVGAFPVKAPNGACSRRIFIVHGHDGELRSILSQILRDLGFEPVVLDEQANCGTTIFASITDETSNVGFAFVLLTPDDVGGLAGEALRPRVRQNVVFEHGLLVGKLGPSRVCAIVKGEIEIPSDLAGVRYIHLSDVLKPNDRPLKNQVARELEAAGYRVKAFVVHQLP